MTQNEDDFSHMDQRINEAGQAAFGRRTLSIPVGGNSPTAYSNDKSRVSRAVFNADGSITTTQSGVSRGMVDPGVKDSGSPFATIRDSNNLRVIQPSELNYESVVTLRNGQTMKLRNAVDAGYVTQRADGSYVGALGETQKKIDEPEIHDDLKLEAFPTENRAADIAMSEIVETTQPTTQLAAIEDLIGQGEIGEHNLSQIAAQMGVEPEAVNEKVQPIIEAFTQQANSLVADYGVDPDSVWAWAHANCSEPLNKAMHRHGTMRQTTGYHGVVKAYIAALDETAPDAILNADFGPGVSARKDHNGKIIIRAGSHGEMPWKSAVRAGLINLKKR